MNKQVANLFCRDCPRHLLVEVDVIFIFVHATAAGINTDTANGATADDTINTPLAKEAATTMLLEILLW